LAETDLFLASAPGLRAASELDDARYYLRRGCGPCADRHLDLAIRHGATQEQVDAVRALAGEAAPAPADPPTGPAV
jgi:AhpD family alkylhydroperoxidase